jgi:hypothetical protein
MFPLSIAYAISSLLFIKLLSFRLGTSSASSLSTFFPVTYTSWSSFLFFFSSTVYPVNPALLLDMFSVSLSLSLSVCLCLDRLSLYLFELI